MIKFVKINKLLSLLTINKFKARYLALTGETVQDNLMENNFRTHYMFGTSRLSDENAAIISSEFISVTVLNEYPANWVDKD